MKLTKRYLAILILVLAVLIFAGWYLWFSTPRTLEEVFLGFGWEDTPFEQTSLSAYYVFHEENEQPGSAPVQYTTTINLPVGDQATDEIYAILRELEFRRVLIPDNSRSHPIKPGDSSIYLTFGSPTGAIRVQFWYDELDVDFVETGVTYDCIAGDFSEIKAQIAQIVLARSPEPERIS